MKNMTAIIKILTASMITVILLLGCAVPITKEGRSVRQIHPTGKTVGEMGCKFLGVVEITGGGFYSSRPEARGDMLHKVRNEVARLGGDSYTLTAVDVSGLFSLPMAEADAYNCKP